MEPRVGQPTRASISAHSHGVYPSIGQVAIEGWTLCTPANNACRGPTPENPESRTRGKGQCGAKHAAPAGMHIIILVFTVHEIAQEKYYFLLGEGAYKLVKSECLKPGTSSSLLKSHRLGQLPVPPPFITHALALHMQRDCVPVTHALVYCTTCGSLTAKNFTFQLVTDFTRYRASGIMRYVVSLATSSALPLER